MNDSRSDFGERLDALAGDGIAGTNLRHPALATDPTGSHGWNRFGWAFAAILLVVGGIALWQAFESASDNSTVSTSDEGSSELPVDGAESPAPLPCSVNDYLPVLRSGLPTYDYDPAGSFRAAADQAQMVVTGTITSAVRTLAVTDGEGELAFTELTVADVALLDGTPVPDVAVIAVNSWWGDRSNPDPIGEPTFFDDLDFVAFLSPWSGIRGDWSPGVEGMYVACGTDSPSTPFIESAGGPGDPTDPTLDELVAWLTPEAGPSLECGDDSLADLADLVDPGFDFDYQPMGSFEAMADLVARVVVADLTMVQQVANDGPLPDDAFIVLTFDDIVVVADNDPDAAITGVSLGSVREVTANADLLADGVEVSGVTVLAFLVRNDDVPGGAVSVVEGLYLACGRAGSPVRVLESVIPPSELAGLTIDDIVAIIEAR